MKKHPRWTTLAGFALTCLIPFGAGAAADEDAPFERLWMNTIMMGGSNQQGGQSNQTLAYTGTAYLSETGHNVFIDASVSRQKVEGVFSKTGGISLGGGLGLGFVDPSLSVGFQLGDSSLRQWMLDLNLAFPITDNFFVGLSFGGSAGSHNGDLSFFDPALAGVQARIDNTTSSSGFSLSYIFSDFFAMSFRSEYDYDTTYQIKLIDYPKVPAIPVNLADQMAVATLAFDFTPWKDFTIEFAPQGGQEYQPAGLVYSREAGGLVENFEPVTQNFAAGSLTLSLSFQ